MKGLILGIFVTLIYLILLYGIAKELQNMRSRFCPPGSIANEINFCKN